MSVRSAQDCWHMVNRCLVCGTKLRFVRSPRRGTKRVEGAKICEQNHARFAVRGYFDESGTWRLEMIMPTGVSE